MHIVANYILLISLLPFALLFFLCVSTLQCIYRAILLFFLYYVDFFFFLCVVIYDMYIVVDSLS